MSDQNGYVFAAYGVVFLMIIGQIIWLKEQEKKNTRKHKHLKEQTQRIKRTEVSSHEEK